MMRLPNGVELIFAPMSGRNIPLDLVSRLMPQVWPRSQEPGNPSIRGITMCNRPYEEKSISYIYFIKSKEIYSFNAISKKKSFKENQLNPTFFFLVGDFAY